MLRRVSESAGISTDVELSIAFGLGLMLITGVDEQLSLVMMLCSFLDVEVVLLCRVVLNAAACVSKNCWVV